VSVLEGGKLSVGGDTKIYAGSTLTLSGAASTLELGGTFTDEGTFDWQSGGVTLNGASASWTNTGGVVVGTLSVKNGGSVTGTTGYVGRYSGSNGTATVTGTTSNWDNSGGLYIGGSDSSAGGIAAVSVLYGGTLSVSGATKIYAGSTLTLGTSTFTSGGIAMVGGTIAASTALGEEGGLSTRPTSERCRVTGRSRRRCTWGPPGRSRDREAF